MISPLSLSEFLFYYKDIFGDIGLIGFASENRLRINFKGVSFERMVRIITRYFNTGQILMY